MMVNADVVDSVHFQFVELLLQEQLSDLSATTATAQHRHPRRHIKVAIRARGRGRDVIPHDNAEALW